jgi:hypothetical protein
MRASVFGGAKIRLQSSAENDKNGPSTQDLFPEGQEMHVSDLNRSVVVAASVVVCLLLAGSAAHGQKPGGQNPSSSQTPSQTGNAASPGSPSSGQPSGAALEGITYSHDTWDQISVLPPPETFGFPKDDVSKFLDNLQGHSMRKDVLIYCYSIKVNTSGGLPLIFEPTPAPATLTKHELCANQIKTRFRGISLVMGRYLVLRVDMTGLPAGVLARIQTLNLNVTSTAGTPINSQRGSGLNPSLVRPRMALLSGRPFPCATDLRQFHPYRLDGQWLRDAFCPTGAIPPSTLVENPNVVYLVWPSPLAADTVATISANLIYTPVAPDLLWKPNTFYPAGSIVISISNSNPSIGEQTNGHYYMALTSGTTPADQPNFDSGVVNVPEFRDPEDGYGLVWQRIGSACQPAPPAATQFPPALDGRPVSIYTSGSAYQTNDIVIPPLPGNCHAYRATVTPPAVVVDAGATPPNFPTNGGTVADGTDSPLSWQDLGYFAAPTWTPGVAYAKGAFVTPSPSNGYMYQATVAGVSGTFQPAFPVADGAPPVSESTGLLWLDVGSSATPPSSIQHLKKWTPATPYALGDGIFDNATGHYYVAIQPGISGPEPGPAFVVPAPQTITDTVPEWQDVGTSPPAGATLGTQPADETVSAENLALPQVHSLAWFNLASGVVVSSLRPTSITSYTGVGPSSNSATFPDVCPAGVSTCTLYTASKGSHLVDPVLGLTVYALHPFDVEQPFRLQDLVPAPTFNLSVLSPTTNFHIGLASEFFVRNLQLTYGVSVVQETRLPHGMAAATIGGQPAYLTTVKQFNKGGFFGFTLNITGLINAATGLVP